MLSISEKYDKFLLTDELREELLKFSVNKYPFFNSVPEIFVEIVHEKNGVIENISEEIDYAKLVRTCQRNWSIR